VNKFVFVFLVLINQASHADKHIVISTPSIALAPASSTIYAGYLMIHNRTSDDISLRRIESTDFENIEIHQTEIIKNLSQMRHLNEITIPANQQIFFKPGGLHLMLHNATIPLVLGEQRQLIFHFSDGTQSTKTFTVNNLTDIISQYNIRNPDEPQTNFMTSFKVLLQRILPQHTLSGLMYKLARIKWEPLKDMLISRFIDLYEVDMSIAKNPDPKSYADFNSFFTRELNTTFRPIDNAKNVIVSPVDGAISQFGEIQDDLLIQAKGKNYSVSTLLGDNAGVADRFKNGTFITIYLSPKDYHRIHMPLDGTLNSMTYIPGKLYSVNKATTNQVNNLFAINERIVNVFDTDIGSVALVMVGAIFVGGMETTWEGEVTPASNRQGFSQNYHTQQINISKGEEMGRFNMGSTVIVLFEPDKVIFESEITTDTKVVMGQKIANNTNNSVNTNN
jgi:phosphatidylserine decarboxylase